MIDIDFDDMSDEDFNDLQAAMVIEARNRSTAKVSLSYTDRIEARELYLKSDEAKQLHQEILALEEEYNRLPKTIDLKTIPLKMTLNLAEVPIDTLINDPDDSEICDLEFGYTPDPDLAEINEGIEEVVEDCLNQGGYFYAVNEKMPARARVWNDFMDKLRVTAKKTDSFQDMDLSVYDFLQHEFKD